MDKSEWNEANVEQNFQLNVKSNTAKLLQPFAELNENLWYYMKVYKNCMNLNDI